MDEQPLPRAPSPGQEDVTESLITLLRQRQAKGIATYGQSLRTFNGRDAKRDALEEAVDLCQYLLQDRLERAATRAEALEEAARLADDCQRNECSPQFIAKLIRALKEKP